MVLAANFKKDTVAADTNFKLHDNTCVFSTCIHSQLINLLILGHKFAVEV